MIQEFPYSYEKQLELQALPEPKHIWFDGERIVLYTGADIPE